MPQRKDPDIPVRLAVALCPWPGASAQRVEELVTRRIEEVMAQNAMVERVTSVSRAGLSVAYVQLDERVVETGKQLDDIKMKLDGILDLPEGAGPINFLKDFGDTAALMLTVTSPKVGDVEIALRARDVRQAIEATRSRAPGEIGGRVSVIACVPRSISARVLERPIGLLVRDATEAGFARDVRPIIGSGFIGIDAVVDHDDAAILAYIDRFVQERLHSSEFHPDTWAPAVIRDPGDTRARLAAVAGEKYSYRELDDFVDLIKRTLPHRAAGLQDRSVGGAEREDLPRVFAGAPGFVWRPDGPARRDPVGAQHHDTGGRDGDRRQEPVDRPVGGVQEREGDRRRPDRHLRRRGAGLPARPGRRHPLLR